MVPLNRTFRLNEDDTIDQEMINNINKKNFSKIPIFSHDLKCKGFLKTKKLTKLSSMIGQSLKNLNISSKPFYVAKNMNLLEAITFMKEKEVSAILVTNC